jgi:hypothetical protein
MAFETIPGIMPFWCQSAPAENDPLMAVSRLCLRSAPGAFGGNGLTSATDFFGASVILFSSFAMSTVARKTAWFTVSGIVLSFGPMQTK